MSDISAAAESHGGYQVTRIENNFLLQSEWRRGDGRRHQEHHYRGEMSGQSEFCSVGRIDVLP